MDQLTAYRVLGLAPDSTQEEVKEAYASLSKKYHPEEHPEEFQRIHEAYSFLTRRRRSRTVETTYSEWEEPKEEPSVEPKQPVVKPPTFNFEEIKPENVAPVNDGDSEEEKKHNFDFNSIKSEKVKQESPTYSFEEAMEKAKIEEIQKLHELALEAAAELKVLASPKYKSNLKAYKALFEDKKYEAIIRRADFLEKLCDVLEDSKLSKKVYNYIIEFYRLRGRNPSELSQVGLRLYQILDAKVGMKQSNPAVFGGVAAAIVAAINAIKPVLRQSDILTGIAVAIIFVLLFVWILKKLKEKRSALLVQAVLSIGIALSQFIVIMFDLYGTLFGSVDNGNTVAGVLFLLAMAWFVVVILIALVKAVVGLVKKIN